MSGEKGKGTNKANQRQGLRHKGGYAKYRNELRHEKSHIRRMTKHLLRFPNDLMTKNNLAALKLRFKAYI